MRLEHRRRSYVELVMNMGPISYWRMGERGGTVARDVCGLNNGAYSGSPTLGVAGPTGMDGDTGVTYNGTSHKITTVGSTGFPTGAQKRTLIAWVNITAGGPNGTLLEYGTLTTTQWFLCYRDTAAGTFVVNNGTTAITLTNTAPATGVWLLFGAVFDGAGWRGYINGVPDIALTALTHTTTLGGVTTQIGSDQFNNWWKGGIKDQALFGRALAPAEFQDLYRAGVGI